jgi:hypothetical protein
MFPMQIVRPIAKLEEDSPRFPVEPSQTGLQKSASVHIENDTIPQFNYVMCPPFTITSELIAFKRKINTKIEGAFIDTFKCNTLAIKTFIDDIITQQYYRHVLSESPFTIDDVIKPSVQMLREYVGVLKRLYLSGIIFTTVRNSIDSMQGVYKTGVPDGIKLAPLILAQANLIDHRYVNIYKALLCAVIPKTPAKTTENVPIFKFVDEEGNRRVITESEFNNYWNWFVANCNALATAYTILSKTVERVVV